MHTSCKRRSCLGFADLLHGCIERKDAWRVANRDGVYPQRRPTNSSSQSVITMSEVIGEWKDMHTFLL